MFYRDIIEEHGEVRKTQKDCGIFKKRMLPVISLPLSEDCPTALRYALAKYAATAVSEAWEGLLELEEAGELEN